MIIVCIEFRNISTSMELTFIVILLVFGVDIISGQHMESPCPDVFQYKSDGGGVYGMIHLRPTGNASMLQIMANFTIATRVLTSYVGHLEPIDSSQNALQNYNRGIPIDYRVRFPVTSPLPRLTAIIVNGIVICHGLEVNDFFMINNYINGNDQSSQNQPNQTNAQLNQHDVQYYQPLNYIFKREVQSDNLPPSSSTNPPQLSSRVAFQQSESVQCGVVAGGNHPRPLKFNGQRYPRGEWPWLVAIYERKNGNVNFKCPGTLVSEFHVITGARCVMGIKTSTPTWDFLVKLGAYILDDLFDDFAVTRTLASMTIHESFNASSLANNIVVLTFERRVEFDANIRPACLWTGDPDQSRIIGTSGMVPGWGPIKMMWKFGPWVVRVPIVDTTVCRDSNSDYPKYTSSNVICAGDRNGSGPPVYDTGAGLFLLEDGRWSLRGVVTVCFVVLKAEDRPCDLKEYIIYTDIAKYLPWIKSIIAK